MSPLVSILIVVAGLTGASSDAAIRQQSSQPANAPVSTAPVVRSTVITSGDIIGDPFLPDQAQENVLVVPTPDLPAESLAELTEDLSIMCRIFDKSVWPARPGAGVAPGYGGDLEQYMYAIKRPSRGAQGLYLDGYGALFFIPVDYPLAPTEKQDAAQAKPKESVDSVWSQTVREMSGQPGDEQQTARNAPTYDPQKVENLRKTLIKTLAHASNIRMRWPQEAITLVVGDLDDSKRPNYRVLPTTRYGLATTGSVAPAGGQSQPATRPPTAALLILRVTKADVDAFAKGQLTLAQFTEKVQVLLSPSISNAPATPATGPTPVGTRR